MHKFTFLIIFFGFLFSTLAIEIDGLGETIQEAKENAFQKMIENFSGQKPKFLYKEGDFFKNLGLITDYQFTKEFEKEGKFQICLDLKVTDENLKKWKTISDISINPPKIFFCLRDSLDKKWISPSITEYQLSQKFKDMGFEIVENIDRIRINTKDDIIKAQDFMMSQQVSFVIFGEVNSRFQGYEEYPIRQTIHEYECNIQIFCVKSQKEDKVNFKYKVNHEYNKYTRANAGQSGFTDIIQMNNASILLFSLLKFFL